MNTPGSTPTLSTAEARLLAVDLAMIDKHEAEKDYDKRNALVLRVLHYAQRLGFVCGVRIDPSNYKWPVVYVDLPTGQVSWHIPQYVSPWDGHTTEQKYERCRDFYRAVFGDESGAVDA